jgi:branched-chain amino acid transport system ATP-binding protein
MGDNAIILETINLTKKFGGLVAVNNVSINVKRNTVTMLMGPNGAGKTTLVNTCTGVLKPDSGKVYFNPHNDNNKKLDITSWPPHKVYRSGFVRTFQIPQPFLGLTVLENVLVALGGRGENPWIAPLRRTWIKEEEEKIKKAFKILRLVKLDSYWDYEAYRLGAGQLKMLEVARALATGAKLIALDEPIGGTDPAYASEIFKHIKDIVSKIDVTFLVIEHRIDIALPYADYVYVMDKGQVIAEGTPNEVTKNSRVAQVYLGE